jgi:hypothetical protein
LIGDPVETVAILGQWTELTRLKASIETGAVVPSVILRKLAAAGVGNVLSRALCDPRPNRMDSVHPAYVEYDEQEGWSLRFSLEVSLVVAASWLSTREKGSYRVLTLIRGCADYASR